MSNAVKISDVDIEFIESSYYFCFKPCYENQVKCFEREPVPLKLDASDNLSLALRIDTENNNVNSISIKLEESLRFLHFELSPSCAELLAICAIFHGNEGVDTYVSSPCVKLWPELTREGVTKGFINLEGRVGRWECNGRAVSTWIQSRHRDHTGRIYLSSVKDAKEHLNEEDSSSVLPARLEVSVEHGHFILSAGFCPPSQEFDLDNIQSNDDDYGMIIVWCCFNQGFIIDVIDVRTNFTLRTIPTKIPESASVTKQWFGGLMHNEGSFYYNGYQEWMRIYRSTRVAISSDFEWILLYSPHQEEKLTLFSNKKRIPMLELSPPDIDDISECCLWDVQFSPGSKVIAIQVEQNLVLYKPTVLQSYPPRQLYQLIESDKLVENVEYFKGKSDINQGWISIGSDIRGLAKDSMQSLLADCEAKYKNLRTNALNLRSEVSRLFIRVSCNNSKMILLSRDWSASSPLFLVNLDHPDLKEATFFGLFSKTSQDAENFIFLILRNEGSTVHWLKLNPIGQYHKKEIQMGKADIIEQVRATSRVVAVSYSTKSIFVLELQTGEILKEHKYQVGVNVSYYKPGQYSFDEGKRIFIQWDAMKKQLMIITPETSPDDFKAIKEHVAPEGGEGSVDRTSNIFMSDCRTWTMVSYGGSIIKLNTENFDTSCWKINFGSGEHSLSMHVGPKNRQGTILKKSQYDNYRRATEEVFKFTPCAFDECQPSYERLKVLEQTKDSGIIDRLFQKYGTGFINCPVSETKSFLHECIQDEKLDWAREILNITVKNHISINLEWKEKSKDGEFHIMDPLLVAIDKRSSPIAELVTEYLLNKQVANAEATAEVFKPSSLEPFMQIFTPVFENLLREECFCIELGTFSVPAEKINRSRTRVLFATCSHFVQWLSGSEECLEFWKILDPDTFKEDTTTRHGTIKVRLVFISIAHAAKFGAFGVLRPLLQTNRLEVEAYRSKAVKWIVDYKWHKFWLQLCLRDIILFVTFIICFSIYASLTGLSGNTDDHNTLTFYITALLLFICVGISSVNLYLEQRQLRRYCSEAKERHKNQWIGMRFYFISVWNWIDLITYLNMVILIPFLHIGAHHIPSHNVALSVTLAIEAVLLWFKALYWMQVFDFFGPLVTMIRSMIVDIVRFLTLALVILIGFGIGFFVLFRHTIHDHDDQDDKSVANKDSFHDCKNDKEEEIRSDQHDSFKGIFQAFSTLFLSMLGNGEPDLFRNCSKLGWFALPMFYLYLIIMMVLMLNLLIAIMGDTYDKVKMKEAGEITKCRASVIDDLEATMNSTNIQNINKSIGKYFFAVEPVEQHEKQEGKTWRGRIIALENELRRTLEEHHRENRKIFLSLQTAIEELKSKPVSIEESSASVSETQSEEAAVNDE
eukprot:g2423.t1